MSYVGKPVVGKPTVIGQGPTVISDHTVGIVNIYSSFNVGLAGVGSTNLVPLLILGLSDPVPSGTPAGTAILRIVN